MITVIKKKRKNMKKFAAWQNLNSGPLLRVQTRYRKGHKDFFKTAC